MERNDFEQHWQENDALDHPSPKIARAESFLQPLFNFAGDKQALNILDAGCGDGVHIRVLSKFSNVRKGRHCWGIDLSHTALTNIKKRLSTGPQPGGQAKWHLTQTDIGYLPFKNERFDATFSYGVLAYTREPEVSFSELYRVTKKNGLLGVWLYPKKTGLSGFLFSTIRTLCKTTGIYGTRLIADCIVPFLGLLPTQSKLTLANASWKQCREIVLVNIAPRQLIFPEKHDVEQWFHKYPCEIIEDDLENPISIWGIKQ